MGEFTYCHKLRRLVTDTGYNGGAKAPPPFCLKEEG